ncbi:ComF family protein [Streptomyces sp. NPDC048845]|uniref:ComF family protein n=1 Tax=Streptomyces sp. NPDC048845 TaxID=3155390 RepID=UPI0034322E34
MGGWWQEITELVLPADCAGCGEPRTALCGRCRAALSGRAAGPVRPDPVPDGLPPVRAAAPYADEVRAVLLAHKERGALGLSRPLGAALAGAARVAAPGDGPLLLVPVPSARRSVAARGHDPTRRIARSAAAELRRAGRPARLCAALRQRRPVADQSGLSARRRLGNLMGALEAPAPAARWLREAPVLLVDDLMTTGASLAESARSVRAVGGQVTGAAVVAAPPTAFRGRRGREWPQPERFGDERRSR